MGIVRLSSTISPDVGMLARPIISPNPPVISNVVVPAGRPHRVSVVPRVAKRQWRSLNVEEISTIVESP
jgi:hypothetical protein